MRQLYVTSNCSTPSLIGVLTELRPGPNEPYGRRGDYEFRYTLGNNGLPKPFLKMTYFPNINKIYTGAEVLEWLSCYFLATNSKRFFKLSLESCGLAEYDEWIWLKVIGQRNCNTNVRLFEELPKGVIRYDR